MEVVGDSTLPVIAKLSYTRLRWVNKVPLALVVTLYQLKTCLAW